jgi:hypothetical protein
MIIILLIMTLVMLAMCGDHQTRYVWTNQSNHTGNAVIATVDTSLNNSGNILSELILGICLVFSGVTLIFSVIISLIFISLCVEAYGSKLIIATKWISQKTLTVFHFDVSLQWGKQENEITSKNKSSNSFIQVIYNKMDEEGRAYLSEAKLEWSKSGLTKSKIERKVLIFAIDYHRGKFIAWMRLPRFVFPIETRH